MVVSLRERRRQMLRDEILQAAQELAAEKGPNALSMEELAASVGISKPTLYSYFATKEDLIVAAAQESMQRLIDVIDTQLTDQTPLQSLLLLLQTTMDILFQQGVAAHRPLTTEMMQLIRSRSETLACIQRIDSAILNLVNRGIDQGEIDPALDTGTLVSLFHGMIHAIKADTISETNTSDPARITATLLAVFERGIRNPHHTLPPGEPSARDLDP